MSRSALVVVAAGEFGAEVLLGLRADERELLSIDDLQAAATRLCLDAKALLFGPHSYVDRFGEYRAPFGMAVKVTKRCCENFSREVLRYLQAEEQELRQDLVSGNLDVSRAGSTDNEAYRERAEVRLGELGPIFAIVRGWCGQEAAEEFREVIALRQVVDRLQGIVKDLASWLKNAGHPQKTEAARQDGRGRVTPYGLVRRRSIRSEESLDFIGSHEVEGQSKVRVLLV